MCVTAFTIAGLAIAGASVALPYIFQPSAPQFPQLPALPTAPDPDSLLDEARRDALRREKLRGKFILTSPAGIIEEPNIGTKTLLGG